MAHYRRAILVASYIIRVDEPQDYVRPLFYSYYYLVLLATPSLCYHYTLENGRVARTLHAPPALFAEA